MQPSLIVLATDFGLEGPYSGQMRARLWQYAPASPVIDLFADLPQCNPRSSAWILAACAVQDVFPDGTVFLCVVDPGVGTARRPVVLWSDGRWFVGPDNGLLAMLARRSKSARAWEISWRPGQLSRTFHGRDLFAPVAAALSAEGEKALADYCYKVEISPSSLDRPDWPDDLEEVVYVDCYGNATTGVRAEAVPHSRARLVISGHSLGPLGTFADDGNQSGGWYINSCGLVEIAINGRPVNSLFPAAPGTSFFWDDAPVPEFAE